MSKSVLWAEVGVALLKAGTAAARGYLRARGWGDQHIKAARLRWLDGDAVAKYWPGALNTKTKGQEGSYDPIGAIILPFPNAPTYCCARIFYSAGTDDSAPKYLNPAGDSKPYIASTAKGMKQPLIVEGFFKAALACLKGVPCIGVNGCHGCHDPNGADLPDLPEREVTKDEARAWFRPELLQFLKPGREAAFITDADCATNNDVKKGQLDFLDAANALGLKVIYKPLPAGGIDDYLVDHSAKNFYALPVHAYESRVVKLMRNPFRDQTEFGIADRFVALFGEDLRFDPSAGWFCWDGSRWRTGKDAELAATEGVRATIATLKEEADAEKHPAKLKARAAAIYEFQNQARIKAITTLIENTRAVRIDAAAFDSEPNYLGVANGVLDIGDPAKPKLIEADRNVLVSKVAAAKFDPKARAPMWEAFVAEATGNDKERTRLLHEIFGAALVGKAQRSEVVFLVGPAFSGKSVFIEVMNEALGDYAIATKADLLLRAGRHQNQDAERPSPFLAVLRGKRLATCGELPEYTPIDDTILKDLTGGDTIAARGLHKEPVTFRNTARVVVRCNNPPMITTTSEAAWSRILIVLLDVVIPEERRDKDLCAKIVSAEAAGVFNLALEGLSRYASRGYRFEVPKVMRDALAKHRAESDVLGAWLDDEWVIDKTKRDGPLQSVVTYGYMEWCKNHGHQPLGSIMLWKKLRERLGYDPVAKINHGEKHALGFARRISVAALDKNVVDISTARKAKF